MPQPYNPFLIAGAVLSASAAALHIVCIVVGPGGYRALGAGEDMARMAEAGSWYPGIVTFCISLVLAAWALYALAGAGMLPAPPLLRAGLCVITAIYVARGLALIPMMLLMPGRSINFWLWSSAICMSIGVVHLIGLRQVWARL